MDNAAPSFSSSSDDANALSYSAKWLDTLLQITLDSLG